MCYLFGKTNNSFAQILPVSVLHKCPEGEIRENSFQRALQPFCVACDIAFCFVKLLENLEMDI